mmetsp:Transcript_1954/g.3065  ORF Transcript_1954/g.3065 Transcript_1954/m.3065 type:complete len:96 (-) Transcript_1954:138-425(-)
MVTPPKTTASASVPAAAAPIPRANPVDSSRDAPGALSIDPSKITVVTGGKKLPVVPGEVRSATTPEEPSSLNVVGGRVDALLSDPVESTRVVVAA